MDANDIALVVGAASLTGFVLKSTVGCLSDYLTARAIYQASTPQVQSELGMPRYWDFVANSAERFLGSFYLL